MKILVDENIPLTSVQELRRMGHDVSISNYLRLTLYSAFIFRTTHHAQRTTNMNKYASIATSADTGAVLKW
jgi:hypothetical protein